MKKFSSYEKILSIARTLALEERVMVSLQVSLLNLTVEAGIQGTYRRQDYCVYSRHGGLLVDMVNESIEEDSNIRCDKDSNTTCDEDSNTTCDKDSNTTCDEDSNTTCDEDLNTTCEED